MTSDTAPSRRIDKWLWCARRFRTRSLAARFIAEKSVRVTRGGATQRVDKPGFLLLKGDEVSYLLGERLHVLTVAGFGDRRRSPAEAKPLFTETSVSSDEKPPTCKQSG